MEPLYSKIANWHFETLLKQALSEMFCSEIFKNFHISLLIFDSTISAIAFLVKSEVMDDTREELIRTTTCLFNGIHMVEFLLLSIFHFLYLQF